MRMYFGIGCPGNSKLLIPLFDISNLNESYLFRVFLLFLFSEWSGKHKNIYFLICLFSLHK